jgi:beta-phosphoglucomutase-like phosphatase (HAD superfamily)
MLTSSLHLTPHPPGDIVPKKKPAPDIYLLAAKELGVDPARCVVVEDSHIGVKAAVAAGMTVFVTKSVSSVGGRQKTNMVCITCMFRVVC